MYTKLSFNTVFTAFILAIFLFATYVYADTDDQDTLEEISSSTQSSDNTTEATTSKEKMLHQVPMPEDNEENIQQNKADRQHLGQEKQDTINNSRQVRITNLAANISNRIEAAIERFTKISARIETRISKLEQAGIDTTDAKQKLNTVKETLDQAKTNISTIDILVYNATTSQTPQEDWRTVKQTFLATGKLIRQSHQELREVIKSLKKAIQENEVSDAINTERQEEDATETPEVTE